jgi:hypothetical protein
MIASSLKLSFIEVYDTIGARIVKPHNYQDTDELPLSRGVIACEIESENPKTAKGIKSSLYVLSCFSSPLAV